MNKKQKNVTNYRPRVRGNSGSKKNIKKKNYRPRVRRNSDR